MIHYSPYFTILIPILRQRLRSQSFAHVALRFSASAPFAHRFASLTLQAQAEKLEAREHHQWKEKREQRIAVMEEQPGRPRWIQRVVDHMGRRRNGEVL